MLHKLRRKDLVFPELSYQILGVLFDVWFRVGHGHRESFYQKAVAQGFKIAGISFREQVPAKLSYKGEIIGTYYFDFLIDDRVVVELKVREYFSKHDIDQVLAYLKAKKLRLGILAHFTKGGVKFKRVVNLT